MPRRAFWPLVTVSVFTLALSFFFLNQAPAQSAATQILIVVSGESYDPLGGPARGRYRNGHHGEWVSIVGRREARAR